MEKATKEKGITLIALIITIIVMLILVGVTVSVALNGGLLKTAKDAAQGTDKARIEEEMQGAILAALDNNGNIELNKLKQEIEKIRGIESVGDSFPLTVKDKSGNEWTIDKYGEIKLREVIEKEVIETDEEYSYWKTDGEGTIIYYEPSAGKQAPETLVVPSKIGDEKITAIGDWALSGLRISRNNNDNGKPILDEYGFPEILDSIDDESDLSSMYITTGPTSKVKNIVISRGIEELGKYSISYNRSLENINIPDSVLIMDEGAFVGCTALEDVTIGKGINTISSGVFMSCISLGKITIPETVDNLGGEVFGGWNERQTIYMKGRKQAPVTVDDYEGIGWSSQWNDGCNANIVWDE